MVNTCNRMKIDLSVDFPGEWALLALGYTQPLQHFHSHLVICLWQNGRGGYEPPLSYKFVQLSLGVGGYPNGKGGGDGDFDITNLI